MRRLAGAAVILIGAVVAARLADQRATRAPVGNAEAPPEALPGAGPTPVTVAPYDAERVAVTHVQGVSIIPARPQRVAALGWADEVLAAGVIPAAATGDKANGFEPHLAPLMRETALIDHTAGRPNYEALAAVAPDLIIAMWYWRADYDQLSAIAPTVILQPGHWFWRARFLDVATVLGRRAAGEARLAALDAELESARRRLKAVIGDGTVAMLRIFAREYRLYGRGYSGPLLYGDLGLSPPEIVKAKAWDRDMVRLSLEGLTALDADHLLLMYEHRVPISAHALDTLLDHPVWAQLPAVKAGHVYQVEDLLMRGGVLSRSLMVSRLVAQLEARLGGGR